MKNIKQAILVSLFLFCGACTDGASTHLGSKQSDPESNSTERASDTGPVVVASSPADGQGNGWLLPYIEVEFDQPVPALQATQNATFYVGSDTTGIQLNFTRCFQSPEKENCLSAMLLGTPIDGGIVSDWGGARLYGDTEFSLVFDAAMEGENGVSAGVEQTITFQTFEHNTFWHDIRQDLWAWGNPITQYSPGAGAFFICTLPRLHGGANPPLSQVLRVTVPGDGQGSNVTVERDGDLDDLVRVDAASDGGAECSTAAVFGDALYAFYHERQVDAYDDRGVWLARYSGVESGPLVLEETIRFAGEGTSLGDSKDVVANMSIDEDTGIIYFGYGADFYTWDGVDFTQFGAGTDLDGVEWAVDFDLGTIDTVKSLVVREDRAVKRYDLATGGLLDEYAHTNDKESDTVINVHDGRVWLPTLEGLTVLELGKVDWQVYRKFEGPEARQITFAPFDSGDFAIVHSNVVRIGRPSPYFSWLPVYDW